MYRSVYYIYIFVCPPIHSGSKCFSVSIFIFIYRQLQSPIYSHSTWYIYLQIYNIDI